MTVNMIRYTIETSKGDYRTMVEDTGAEYLDRRRAIENAGRQMARSARCIGVIVSGDGNNITINYGRQTHGSSGPRLAVLGTARVLKARQGW